MCYKAEKDEIEDLAGRDQSLQEMKNAYVEHINQTTEVGVLFLVPATATVEGFRLTGAGPDLTCESPLSVALRRRPR